MDDFAFQNDELPSPSREDENTTFEHLDRPVEVRKALMLPSFAEQVDAFAEFRRYFRPEDTSETYPAITAYLASEIDVNEAVSRIAAPIEAAYTTADHGRKLLDIEKRNTTYEGYSTEGYLWDLYYGILHAARRIPWDSEGAQQEKLLDLLKALKARPDPDPSFKTMDIENDWVLSAEGLWSSLLMMGPSSRESWNDCPGYGAGFEQPEIKAWANVNAFLARVTRDNVQDYWIYCGWATNDALERRYKKNENETLESCIPAALAWIAILGEQMYEMVENVATSMDSKATERLPSKKKIQAGTVTKDNWNSWKKRFREVVDDEALSDESRIVAATASDTMERIEKQARTEKT